MILKEMGLWHFYKHKCLFLSFLVLCLIYVTQNSICSFSMRTAFFPIQKNSHLLVCISVTCLYCCATCFWPSAIGLKPHLHQELPDTNYLPIPKLFPCSCYALPIIRDISACLFVNFWDELSFWAFSHQLLLGAIPTPGLFTWIHSSSGVNHH